MNEGDTYYVFSFDALGLHVSGSEPIPPGGLTDAGGYDTFDFSGVRNGPVAAWLSDDGMANFRIVWFSDGTQFRFHQGFTPPFADSTIERIIGTKFDDSFILSSLSQKISGGRGGDLISHGGGRDVLVYETARDSLNRPGRFDKISGFDGNDKFDLRNIDFSPDDRAVLAIKLKTSLLWKRNPNEAGSPLPPDKQTIIYANTDRDPHYEFKIKVQGYDYVNLNDLLL